MCIVISHGKPCELQCLRYSHLRYSIVECCEPNAAAAACTEDHVMEKPKLPEWPVAGPGEVKQTGQQEPANAQDREGDHAQTEASPQPLTRDRVRRILVGVSREERAEIKRRAEMAGMSVAGYLRSAALHAEIRSIYDYAAIRDLCKVSGDLGRFGGLLKLWLTERRGEGASVQSIETLLHETRVLVDELRKRIVLP